MLVGGLSTPNADTVKVYGFTAPLYSSRMFEPYYT
jgi:hypothetical protein